MACGLPSNEPAQAQATSSPTSGTAAPSALETQTRRFAPVDLTAPVDALPANEAEALRHIIAAARVMDGLFLEQVWAGNSTLLTQLAADTSPQGRAELHYFLINKGPWSRLDHNASFVRKEFAVPEKPPQANF